LNPIGVPDHVREVKERYAEQMRTRPPGEIFGVGLSYDGGEWTVHVVYGPRIRLVDEVTAVDGVRITYSTVDELRAREA
jgi:hypothetical protein